MTLAVYGGRGYCGSAKTACFRTMTLEEMKALSPGAHVWFRTTSGDARMCKVNGKPKTWKRTPSRVEVPVKYGMYEYGTFTADENRLLVPVPEEETGQG